MSGPRSYPSLMTQTQIVDTLDRRLFISDMTSILYDSTVHPANDTDLDVLTAVAEAHRPRPPTPETAFEYTLHATPTPKHPDRQSIMKFAATALVYPSSHRTPWRSYPAIPTRTAPASNATPPGGPYVRQRSAPGPASSLDALLREMRARRFGSQETPENEQLYRDSFFSRSGDAN
ncbi:hypothetical protein D9619_011454 [Psilocybe cf. subviscida]|uniref:Uncharacterized protein n=1 Tax=Psilocybe cf. subviscida TaxID=2480587 RepID=A0A8H5BT46_9AGAR|nr:hypothetical protein D9619_011454 [Psilocybe cf. subviscida]